MKTYIQPETEITIANIGNMIMTSISGGGSSSDPLFDGARQSTALFFDEEEENYENIPLFEVRHKSVWE